ncbi:MAG: AraC family transcriptional regulator [Clostridia bacterium]|nr:AraC family transcriptional regulator [Clostridia bacterium]
MKTNYSEQFGFYSMNVFFYHGKPAEKQWIYDVGYDDFHKVAPLTVPRVQNKYTIHYVLSGSGTLHFGPQSHAVSRGGGFVVPPGVSFCYYPDRGNEWQYVWFGLSMETSFLLERAGFSQDNPVYRLEKRKEAVEEALLASIFPRPADTPGDYLKAEGAFLTLLGCILENCPCGEEDRTRQTKTTVAQEVFRLIQINYDNPELSVQMLADIVHVSHSYLCKLYPAAYGMTVREAIIRRRMAEAERLLLSGDLDLVKDIAYRVGYEDDVHFSKEFRRLHGVSATEYRKNNQLP